MVKVTANNLLKKLAFALLLKPPRQGHLSLLKDASAEPIEKRFHSVIPPQAPPG